MRAYTKSDVLVIDTSLKDWKFDGWVYRNRNKDDEWKVKEKIKFVKSKSKSRSFVGSKKSKLFDKLEGKDDELNKVKKGKDDEKKVFFNLIMDSARMIERRNLSMMELVFKQPKFLKTGTLALDHPRNLEMKGILLSS